MKKILIALLCCITFITTRAIANEDKPHEYFFVNKLTTPLTINFSISNEHGPWVSFQKTIESGKTLRMPHQGGNFSHITVRSGVSTNRRGEFVGCQSGSAPGSRGVLIFEPLVEDNITCIVGHY